MRLLPTTDEPNFSTLRHHGYVLKESDSTAICPAVISRESIELNQHCSLDHQSQFEPSDLGDEWTTSLNDPLGKSCVTVYETGNIFPSSHSSTRLSSSTLPRGGGGQLLSDKHHQVFHPHQVHHHGNLHHLQHHHPSASPSSLSPFSTGMEQNFIQHATLTKDSINITTTTASVSSRSESHSPSLSGASSSAAGIPLKINTDFLSDNSPRNSNYQTHNLHHHHHNIHSIQEEQQQQFIQQNQISAPSSFYPSSTIDQSMGSLMVTLT